MEAFGSARERSDPVQTTCAMVAGMKRLILSLAAVVAAAASPVVVDLDLAQAKDGDSRAEQRREGRGWERGRGEGRGRYEGRRRGDDDRGRGRGDNRGRGRWDDERPAPRYYQGGPGDYPRPPMVRPGGRLPPAYRGAVIYDYHRYRLRPPPHGYAWFRAPDAFLLVSLVDGQVFDVIPD